MPITEITIRFIGERGKFEQNETYVVSDESNISSGYISKDSQIVKVCHHTKVFGIGTLPHGDRFLLVDKKEPLDLDELTKDLEKVYKLPTHKVIKFVNDLPSIIANTVNVPDNINELLNNLIDIKLTEENIDDCIELLERMPYSDYVDDTIRQLKEVKDLQGGVEINNINSVYLLNIISQNFKGLNMYKKSKSVLLGSLSLDEMNPYTNTQLGSVSRLLKNYDDSIKYYNQALEIAETSYVYTGLGTLYKEIKEYNKAEEFYLKALELENNQRHLPTHKGLGALYYAMNRFEEGNKHYRLANVSTKELYEVYNQALKDKEKYKAIELLKLIIQMSPNDYYAKWQLRRLD